MENFPFLIIHHLNPLHILHVVYSTLNYFIIHITII